MSANLVTNFAGRLTSRLGPGSCIIDAATEETVSAESLPGLIVGQAAGFLSAGLQPGDRLLIGCDLSPASALVYLGAMYAGLVVVPLEERVLSLSGEDVCRATGAKSIWTPGGGRSAWPVRVGIQEFTGAFPACAPGSLAPYPSAPGDLAVLTTTSGSTGTPRFVMVTHGNLAANTEAISRSQRLGRDERAMLILPLSYCFGASVLHTHLDQGGSVVFDGRFMFPDKVLRAIDTLGCTTFAGVPTVYTMLLRRSSLRSIPLPRLRRFLQAGGPLAPASVREMREIVPTAEFFVMYGQTEATARISCLPPERLAEKLGSAGLPLDNLELRIVDEEGREVPQGASGEIWVRGPSICSTGYLDDPEESARKFHEGWLRTGDIASVDPEGFIWITGRQGDFMKIRGVRVSFTEVEARVSQIQGVFECAAASVAHPDAGEAIALFVVPQPGAEDLPGRIRSALPPHWTCGEVNIVGELPKTANGKIARALLRRTT